MVNRITIIIVNIVMFYMLNIICRYNSCYFGNSKFKKYIIINNKTITKILIARSVGRDKIVKLWDYDKMSLVGLISYIIVGPINLLNLILKTMLAFDYKEIGNIYQYVYFILGVVTVLNLFILVINTWNCHE